MNRHLAVLLHRSVQAGGPVLLGGPRGAGKSTLARQEFPGRLYVDLADARERILARGNPAAFLAKLRRPSIVDGLERCPELVELLRAGGVDSPILFVSNLRLDVPIPGWDLYPPTSAERAGRPAMPLELLGRFVPAASQPRASVRRPASETVVGRRNGHYLIHEVPLLVRPHDQDRFAQFASLVELRTGQLLHQQEMARELGVSHRTVVRWLEVLDACYLTLRVETFGRAFSRRLVRRPKLHFLGSAASFETEVVTELYANSRHAGLSPVLRYWRDSNGLEVPLIVQAESGAPPVPCGVAEVPSPADEAQLLRWMRLARVSEGAMIGRSPALLERRNSPVRRYALADF